MKRLISILIVFLMLSSLFAQEFKVKTSVNINGAPVVKFRQVLPWNYDYLSAIGTELDPFLFGYFGSLYSFYLYSDSSQFTLLNADSVFPRFILFTERTPFRFSLILPSQYSYSSIGKDAAPVDEIHATNIYATDVYADSVHTGNSFDTNDDRVDSINYGGNISGWSLSADTSGYDGFESLDGDKNKYIYSKLQREETVNKIVPRTGGVMVWHDDGRLSDWTRLIPIYLKYGAKGTFNIINRGPTITTYFGKYLDDKTSINYLINNGFEIGNHTIYHRTVIWYNFLDSLPTDTTYAGTHSAVFYDSDFRKAADYYSNLYLGTTGGFNEDPIDSCGGIFDGIADRTPGSTKGRANCYIWDRLFHIQRIWYEKEFRYFVTNFSMPGGPTRTISPYYSGYTANFWGMVNPRTGESLGEILRKWGFLTCTDMYYMGRVDGQTTRYGSRDVYFVNAGLFLKDGLTGRGLGYSMPYSEVSNHTNSYITDTLAVLPDFKTALFDSLFSDVALRYIHHYASGEWTYWGYDSVDSLKYNVALEFFMKFFKDNKIPVTTYKEAYDYCYKSRTPEYENVFPNPNFKQTLMEYFPNSGDVRRNYPDGWTSSFDDYWSTSEYPIVTSLVYAPDSVSKSMVLCPNIQLVTRSMGLYPGRYKLTFFVRAKNSGDVLNTTVAIIKSSTPINSPGDVFSNKSFTVGSSWQKEVIYFNIQDEPSITNGLVGLDGTDNKNIGFQFKITTNSTNSDSIYFTMPSCFKMKADEF